MDQLPVARFWTRRDGSACFLRKDQDGWWLSIERDDLLLKLVKMGSPKEAIQVAAEWSRDEPRRVDATNMTIPQTNGLSPTKTPMLRLAIMHLLERDDATGKAQSVTDIEIAERLACG